MPFSSGTFSLYTPGNPVVTGTTISSTWANSTLSDIATGLSTCILKDGTSTVTANIPMAGYFLTNAGIKAADGTAGAPSIAFNNDADCGFWRKGANNFGAAINGSEVVDFSATGISVTGVVKTAGYTVATLPTPTTGMRAYVTDSSVTTFLNTVAGGGASVVPVFYNGTNWVVG